MPCGISIKCLNDTAFPILRLWHEASSFEVSASMVALNYPPHLTLAVFPDHPGHVDEVLEDVFVSQPRLSIPFLITHIPQPILTAGTALARYERRLR
jgi:hypothetical protein